MMSVVRDLLLQPGPVDSPELSLSKCVSIRFLVFFAHELAIHSVNVVAVFGQDSSPKDTLDHLTFQWEV